MCEMCGQTNVGAPVLNLDIEAKSDVPDDFTLVHTAAGDVAVQSNLMFPRGLSMANEAACSLTEEAVSRSWICPTCTVENPVGPTQICSVCCKTNLNAPQTA